MSASAGRVLILLKGEYNNSVQYQMLDAVKYQGSLYIARKTTLGNVPQEGEYWMLSAVGGQWGEIGGTLADQLDLKTALDGKQATLTFDNTPTASSTNPVTSDGIKTAIDTKITNPGGGSVGDVLKKTANGEEWATETASAWGSITGTLSDQTDLQNVLDGKAGIGSIATIEANFATTAHSVGEYVYWNGHLYEVIAAIAANEALIDGTNVTAVSVGDELTSLKAGLTPIIETYGTHGVTVYKIGRICVLKISEPSGLSHSQNTWNTYAVLDSKFHPIGVTDAVVANNAASSQTQSPLQLRIDSDGTVKVYNFTLSSLQAVGSVTYISKN